MKQKLILLSVFIFAATLLRAQVTIGSSEKPNEGTLLDLKQWSQDDGKANSKQGLALPRVKLKDKYSLSDIPSITDPVGYEGLMVYNVSEEDMLCPGLHVWNGDKWQTLVTKVVKPDITMTDASGNVYNAKWFPLPCQPEEGAYWITDNLYTALDKNGAPFVGGAILNPGKDLSTNPVLVHGVIPAGFVGNYEINGVSQSSQTYAEFAKIFGLLYTRPQALIACPTGWGIPTREDWENLTKLGDHMVSSASKPSNTPNQAGAALRANPGTTYKAADDTRVFVWGLEDPVINQENMLGFNAKPNGRWVPHDAFSTFFARWAFYWQEEPGFKYYMTNHYGYLYWMEETDSAFLSYGVRCVRKDN